MEAPRINRRLVVPGAAWVRKNGFLTKRFFANFVLTTGGVLVLSVILADLYQYGWTGQRQSTPLTDWTERHIVLAVLAVLSFASLRLRSALKIAVAVVCVSLVAGLYTADVVLASPNSALAATMPLWSLTRNSALGKKEIVALARGFGVTMDSRDRVELVTDFQKRHVDAVPAVMIGSIVSGDISVRLRRAMNAGELMPLGGISNALTILCNESGQYVTYESDEHGFRNPKGMWGSARADMAVVGESFAQGYCVPDGENFVDSLRAQYPVTLNLGISGQSSLLQLAAIKEYLPRYAPKIVLWVYCEGIDPSDLHDEATNPLLMRYLEPTFSQHLLTRQPEIDTALRRLVADTDTFMNEREAKATTPRSSFVDTSLGIIKLWHLRHEVELRYVGQTPDSPFSAVLAQARTVTSNWGGTLYFVYLPSWTRYKSTPTASEREHTTVLNLVRAQGIPVIDVEPSFDAQNDPLSLFPFRRFGHYNEIGNRIVASTVLKSLPAHEHAATD